MRHTKGHSVPVTSEQFSNVPVAQEENGLTK